MFITQPAMKKKNLKGLGCRYIARRNIHIGKQVFVLKPDEVGRYTHNPSSEGPIANEYVDRRVGEMMRAHTTSKYGGESDATAGAVCERATCCLLRWIMTRVSWCIVRAIGQSAFRDSPPAQLLIFSDTQHGRQRLARKRVLVSPTPIASSGRFFQQRSAAQPDKRPVGVALSVCRWLARSLGRSLARSVTWSPGRQRDGSVGGGAKCPLASSNFQMHADSAHHKTPNPSQPTLVRLNVLICDGGGSGGSGLCQLSALIRELYV